MKTEGLAVTKVASPCGAERELRLEVALPQGSIGTRDGHTLPATTGER